MKNIIYILLFTFLSSSSYAQCVIACKGSIEAPTNPWSCEAEYTIPSGSELLDGDYTGCNLDLSVDLNGMSSGQTTMLAVGTYNLMVTDNNTGNQCLTELFVKDLTPPVPVVVSLSTVLLDNGEFELWAVDFDAGSWDNCSGVRFTFTDVNPNLDPNFDIGNNSSSRLINCNDYLSADANGNIPLTIYVWDEEDYSNFAIVNLNLVDKDDYCQLIGPHVIVDNGQCGGFDFYLNDNLMAQSFSTCASETDPNQVIPGNNVLSLDSDPSAFMSAYSTLDLVFLQKGLINGFDNNFQVVAGDIDLDGTLSTEDLLAFRELILGILNTDDYALHHLFTVDHSFPMDFDPFDFVNDFTSINVDEAELQDKYYVKVIKLGDVSGAQFNAEEDTHNRNVQKLSYEDEYLQAGTTYTKHFSFDNDLDLRAMILGLSIENANISSITSSASSPTFMPAIINNEARISVLSGISNTLDNFSFEIEFTPLASGLLSNMISLNDNKNEYIDSALSLSNITLQGDFVNAVSDDNNIEVSIFPNPSSDKINIDFANLGQDLKEVIIYNAEGSLLNNFQTNETAITLEKVDYQSGVLIIQVISNNINHSEKVIFH